MSWFGSLLGRWRSGSLANPEVGVQLPGPEYGRTESEISVSDERAMAVSTVWGCVRIVTQSGGTLPLGLYRKDAETRVPLERGHFLHTVLKRRPNAYMNPKEFRQAMWAQRMLNGNACARIVRNSQGQPSALVPMNWQDLMVDRQPDGVRYRYATENGRRELWNRNGRPPEVFHWRGFSPDGVIGMSPLRFGAQALGVTVSAERAAGKGFTARPPGVIQTDREVTADQQKRLRQLWGNIAESNSQTGDGKWWLLPPGFRYQAIGIPPDDLQMLESRQFQVQEICRFYGVPAVLMDGGQGGGSAWPASYEKQVLAFLTFTLKPLLEELEDKITECLVPDDEEIYAEHNTEGFLRTDSNSRATFYSSMVQNGLMTRNEVRKLENLPRSEQEGADDLTVQLNLAQINNLPGPNQGDQPNAE